MSKFEHNHVSDAESELSASLTTAQVLINKLTEKITRNELRVGEILTEAGVAGQYGTSRTPAREALKALVQAGLVEHTARRYMVKEVNLENISELYRIRASLEELLVQELAVSECRPRLEELAKRLERDGKCDDGIVSHFHEALVAICPNSELRSLLRSIYVKMSPYRILDGQCRASEVDEDHRQLLELLLNGEVSAAQTLMKDHIGKSQHAISLLAKRGIVQVTFNVDG